MLEEVLAEITPSADDVAVLLRSRTEIDAGERTGKFTEHTTPSIETVEAAIANAAGELDDLIGLDTIHQRYRDEARRLVAVRAAGQLLLGEDDPSTEASPQLASYTAQWLQRIPDFVAIARGPQWVDIS